MPNPPSHQGPLTFKDDFPAVRPLKTPRPKVSINSPHQYSSQVFSIKVVFASTDIRQRPKAKAKEKLPKLNMGGKFQVGEQYVFSTDNIYIIHRPSEILNDIVCIFLLIAATSCHLLTCWTSRASLAQFWAGRRYLIDDCSSKWIHLGGRCLQLC